MSIWRGLIDSHVHVALSLRMAEQATKFDVGQAAVALKALKNLRNNVGTLFQTLTDGIGLQYGQDGRESRFVSELQQQMGVVQSSVK